MKLSANKIKAYLVRQKIDIMVDKQFYTQQLKQLSLNDHEIEKLYKHTGSMIGFMSIIRGCYLGIIPKSTIDLIMKCPTDVTWLIQLVMEKNCEKLELGELKVNYPCLHRTDLYHYAVYHRMNGVSTDKINMQIYRKLKTNE